MTEPSDEIAFWLLVRQRSGGKPWLFVPLAMSDQITLALVPNTVATRSVIVPRAYSMLRTAGLLGANIYDIQTGRQSCVISGATLGGQPIPNIETQVRDVEPFRNQSVEYAVDGYLGLDFLFGKCASLAIETQTLRVRLRLRH